MDRTAAGSSDGWEPGLSRNVKRPISNTPEISQAQPTSHLRWAKDNIPMRNTTVPTSPAMPVPKALILFCLSSPSVRPESSYVGCLEAGPCVSAFYILDASVVRMQPASSSNPAEPVTSGATGAVCYRQAKWQYSIGLGGALMAIAIASGSYPISSKSLCARVSSSSLR